MNTAPAWFDRLRNIRSRGSRQARPGSLAGLHAARQAHAGQFFTPPALVELMWRIAAEPMEEHARSGGKARKLAIFDNSCGSGRMFWPADPERHELHGIDIDGESVEGVANAAHEAGFKATIRNAGLEEMDPGQADIAFINPPFGLTLKSPFLTATPGVTTTGAYGAHSHALSHLYAVTQALAACQIVLAIVPSGTHCALASNHQAMSRLRGVIALPTGSFRAEGTEVSVELLVFGRSTHSASAVTQHLPLKSIDDALPMFGLSLDLWRSVERPKPLRIKDSAPYSRLPVTGDPRVRLTKAGRRVKLKFACALTEAKVMNVILRRFVMPPDQHRLPKGVTYAGEGWLDLENLLGSHSPRAAIETLCSKITAAGGKPELEPSLAGYINHRLKADRIRMTPFRRFGFVAGTGDIGESPVGTTAKAVVTKSHLVDPVRWDSPLVKAGTPVEITVEMQDNARCYQVHSDGELLVSVPLDVIQKHYRVELEAETGWTLIHPGRRETFPELAEHRARLGRQWDLERLLHWEPGSSEPCYQFEDVVEMAMSDRGTLGWDPGCGKARAAVALCLMGGEHNLICVESHLVPEMVAELQNMGLDERLWQVIDSPSALETLRKVNVISYARLRGPLCKGATRRTYARSLRRRIHTAVADEGHIVRNRQTAQTQALWMLSPKRRYAMTGTPISNYCRDALPLMIWAGGDGTAFQRYGEYQPLITEGNLSDMSYAQRGLEAFRDKFVTLEWAVREFDEDLRSGAKREVPRLRSVDDFRALIAPHILRRVHGEPELARWIKIPVPTVHTHDVAWDKQHLKVYLKTAYEFADWFKRQREDAGHKDKNLNLVSILAHINSVFMATNAPAMLTGPAGCYAAETSKQRFAVAKIKQFVEQGRKTILYATNPLVLEAISQRLAREGIASVVYSGTRSITSRTRELNEKFRNGDTKVLLVGLFCGQTGLNIPQASRVIFYNRAWTPKAEAQAGCRVLRPQQQDDVEFHFLHLAGSIDIYQGMHVTHKKDAIDAGLDFADQEIEEGEFMHLTTVIGRFCEDLAGRWGLEGGQTAVLKELEHEACLIATTNPCHRQNP